MTPFEAKFTVVDVPGPATAKLTPPAGRVAVVGLTVNVNES